MKYIIYRITNKIDGKIYIGKHQTNDIDDRYMGSGKLIRRAIKKYGLENFVKEILHVFDTEEEMNSKEKELVTEEFCLREDTYNICPGGQGGWGYVNSHGMNVLIQNQNLDYTEISRIANIAKNKKAKDDPEWDADYRERISLGLKSYYDKGGINSFKGKTHSSEWKENQSTKMKGLLVGDKNPAKSRKWIKNLSLNQYSFVLICDIDYWISQGWEIGKLQGNESIAIKLVLN